MTITDDMVSAAAKAMHDGPLCAEVRFEDADTQTIQWCMEMARAALEAGEAAAWQPVELAPKDGTDVLLYCRADEPEFVVCVWEPPIPSYGSWAYVDCLLAEAAPDGPPDPTHFRHLPAPPTEGDR